MGTFAFELPGLYYSGSLTIFSQHEFGDNESMHFL